MRNLKRALSLALATVMTLGLMVVGTSAAGYTDVTSEDNQEAIEVLQEVGIMTGVTDDEFNPDGLVTRNQMAVIMSQLLNLDYDYYRGINAFTDVPAWAAPYVAACVAEGVTAGIGGGLYGGDNQVTAAQAALMIMKALGYFQYQGDFNPDWQVATIRQGSYIGLFDGIDSSAEAALTRGQVAQMVLNGLKSDMVIFTGTVGTELTLPDGTKYTAGYVSEYTPRTSSDDKYNALVGGTSDIAGDERYIVQLGEELFDGNLTERGTTDDFGRPASEWKYKTEFIGLYLDDSDLIATYEGVKAAKGDLYDLLGARIVNSIGTDYDLTVYVDGVAVTNPNPDNYFDRNSSSAAGVKNGQGIGQTGNGVLTQVYLIDHNDARVNDDIVITMVNTYLMKATSDYNATRELVTVEPVIINSDGVYNVNPALPATLEQEDFDVDGVKEGDYLLVTYSREDDSVQSVEPAEILTGTVTEYTETENVYIGGTKYSYNSLLGTNEKDDYYTINEDATVVLDAYGYIIYVDEAVSTNSYVYIQDIVGASGLKKTAIAAAYFTDGTFDEIHVDEYVTAAGVSNTTGSWLTTPGNIHGWYTYMVDSNENYTLYQIRDPRFTTGALSADNTDTDDEFIVSNKIVKFLSQGGTSGAPIMNAPADGANLRADADTIFLVLDQDDDISVYTGVEAVPNVIAGADADAGDVEIRWVVEDGYAQYVFIDVSGDDDDDITIDDVNNVADFMFILKDTGNRTVVEGTTYYQYNVVLDGEETTKYIARTEVGSAGELRYNIKENDEGYIRRAELMTHLGKDTHNVIALNGTAAATIEQEGRTLDIAGHDYITNADTDINLIIGKGCSLLHDSGANYETYLHTTVGTLAGTVYDQYLEGKAYVVVNEDDNELAEHIYVYVSQAYDVAQALKLYSDVTFENSASVAGCTVSFNGETKTFANNGSTDLVFEDVLYVSGGTNVSYTLTHTDGRIPYTGTVTVNAATVTVPAVNYFTVGGVANFSYSGDNVTYLAAGSSIVVPDGGTVYVRNETVNQGITSASAPGNANMELVTAPAAGVKAVYKFTVNANVPSPDFTTATVYSVSIAGGSTKVVGLDISVTETVVNGGTATLTLSGVASTTGTLTITANDGASVTVSPATLSVIEGTDYNAEFTIAGIDADTTISFSFA